MDLKQKYGSTALVAGASEGIGAAFASLLASEGLDLVLVARRPGPLKELAGSLESKYGISTLCLTIDLSDTAAVTQILEKLNGREINFLVYNAALSFIGPFLNNSQEELLQAAGVNMLSPLQLVRHYGQEMKVKGRGGIVLMTSLAGFQGSGFLSLYAGTKAFNRILAESLWYEWKTSGVEIIACCAGATATPGYIKSQPLRTGLFTPRVLDPREVVYECIRNLGKSPSFITGRGNRIASFIMQKILPRKMAINIMGDTTRKMYKL